MRAFLAALAALALTAGQAEAQSLSKHNRTLSPAVPVAASSIASPVVDTPAGVTPCTVTLFSNYVFQDYSGQSFNYAPTCPGPWSKVVFKGNFNVSAGIQFDRTANIQLGYVNIYFGTTEEPSPTNAPAWQVQRDLTDYASLFTAPQTGEVDIYNIVDSTYTGIIYGTATLEFYPVATGAAPPVTADAVYPLPNGPGAPYHLNTTTDQLSETFTLPTNVERAYLDVVAQSQQSDEFWYTCVPTDVSAELESCGNTAFRETEISIDGQPAGVAPVSPWIFTGGIDPYLWTPIPGVQTLSFVPYRVDLSPFAALLSNGQPHTVGISVFNANNYFQATGTLLVYLDHGSTTVTGGLAMNTLTPPNPSVVENLNVDPSGNVSGTVSVSSNRSFTISGYVQTSHGPVTTVVNQTEGFTNSQNFTINATTYVQDISQRTDVPILVSVVPNGIVDLNLNYQFPLSLNINEYTNDQGIALQTTVYQNYYDSSPQGTTSNSFAGTDTLQFDPNFNIIGNSGQKSSQTVSTNQDDNCHGFIVTAADNQGTGVKKTTTCPSPH